MRFIHLLLASVLVLCVDATAQTVSFSADDSTGGKVVVPLADRCCVLAFVRADQQQSRETLEQIKPLANDKVQVIVVVSGELAVDDARKLADATTAKPAWPVVAD